MAWIQPNSTVRILRGVPLDIDDENTFYFFSKAAQTSAFAFYTKFALTNKPQTVMYQRHNKNSIRIEKKGDLLYDCNYMMFQNTEYGDKWFYAFITEVNYVNDNVSEVVYEIDDIQTWFFDYHLEECFVEREHTASDNVGDNLQPENLNVGEYFIDNFTVPSQFNRFNTSIVLASSYEAGTEVNPIPTMSGHVYRGVYSGCTYYAYPNTEAGAALVKQHIRNLWSILYDRTDSIINIFICPNYLLGANDPNNPAAILPSDHVTSEEIVIAKKNSGAIDGYTPRNNKLYTYPYNFLYVTNFQGIGQAFPYEYFNDLDEYGYPTNNCVFQLGGDMTANPTVTIFPTYYKGQLSAQDEMLSASGYPQCTWNSDAFKAWLAQARGLGVMALSAIGVAGGLGALGVVGAAKSAYDFAQPVVTDYLALPGDAPRATPQPNAAMNIASAGLGAMKRGFDKAKPALLAMTLSKLRDGYDAFVNPIYQRGNQSGSALLTESCLGFGFGNKHITAQFAKRIDSFFDMYGYACNEVKIPNTAVRTEWTYTKTIGCHITGNLPADNAKRICQRFDNGVRFWTNPSHIGDYSHNANNVLI